MASKQSMDDEMARPSTSKSRTNDPLQIETLQLISRVLEKCESEKHYSNKRTDLSNPSDPLKRAQYFTGLHPSYLQKIKEDQSIQFTTYYDDYDVTNFEKWLQLKLFRSVKPGNVIVLRNKKHVNKELLEKPTLNSLKVEMKDWLDFYNVPYEENMSKIELYTLVEKFTNNIDKLYKIDNIAKTFGVEILRLPNSVSDLSPAHTGVYMLIQKNVTRQKDFQHFLQSFQDIVSTVDKEYLQSCDEHVAVEERVTLKTDMKLDEIMDNIVDVMKKTKFDESLAEDSDLPDCSDSE
ncbi:uncharacterized protein LOC113240373 [Hyposmocoma kahamanoa]|uniref:uncharacterized protein LOC113240373 n=1 Tax=Hyposmocoma kahamanoa TaxID=1477025 RepID=UPI000E6D5C9E|nr:uncharacterized protein LOC113240373 [Hyposmocoma kahamanoa]